MNRVKRSANRLQIFFLLLMYKKEEGVKKVVDWRNVKWKKAEVDKEKRLHIFRK